MKEVKSVELILENCEVIEIKREHIGVFHVLDIKKSISRDAINSINDYLEAEEIFIQISSKANNPSSYVEDLHDGEITPFDRLMRYADITALNIKYQDDSEEYIFVKWGGDSDYTNEYQSVATNEKTGDLYIVISEKENVESYFKEYLQDENNSFWELLKEDWILY